jgi:hypothetical protein
MRLLVSGVDLNVNIFPCARAELSQNLNASCSTRLSIQINRRGLGLRPDARPQRFEKRLDSSMDAAREGWDNIN